MSLKFVFIWKIFLLLSLTSAKRNANVAVDLYPTLPSLVQGHNYDIPLAPINSNPLYAFSTKLFRILGPSLAETNLVYSPLSLQTALSFIYTGAENETAKELRRALEIPELPAEVARLFQSVLDHVQQQTSPELQLNMANKLYYSEGLKLKYDFFKTTIPYFKAEAEAMDFRVPDKSAYEINKWVADRTNHKILDLIGSGVLDSNTKAVLVNAIYLKAKWAEEFSTHDTERADFQIARGRTVPVNMMYNEEDYNFAELSALNAKAVELPFSGSDLSMLIILPNEVDGLAQLETNLGNVDLNSLVGALKTAKVMLYLPKFRIDFDINMLETLKKLGVSRLFSERAQLNGFFNNQTVQVSKIQHKAFINVNEGGVEAAAATFSKLIPLSLPFNEKIFKADHPFVFIIRNSQAVFFIGHVVNP